MQSGAAPRAADQRGRSGRQANPIDALAARLQALPPEIRWLNAQQEIIRARACGLPTVRGPWTRRAGGLIRLAEYIGLGRASAVAVHVVLLLTTYAAQLRTPQRDEAAALFVGIRALSEPQLIRRFERLEGRPATCVDERMLTGFFRLGHVELAALVREAREVSGEIWQYLDRSQPLSGLTRSDLLTGFVLRGHRYVYLRAWFRRFLNKPQNSRVIAFSAASCVSYAAVAAGAEAVYFAHGFQGYALVYPDFAAVECGNRFEAEHVSRRLPGSAVRLVGARPELLETRRVAAICGTCCELWRHDLARSFVEWARRNELPVVVRKHPVDASGYWEQWRRVEGVELVDGDDDLASFLDRYRPRLLATWVSTALLDALAKGVVPVTVDRERLEILDTVYPIRAMSLCWPEQKALAEKLVDDAAAREAFIAKKTLQATGRTRRPVSPATEPQCPIGIVASDSHDGRDRPVTQLT